MKREDCAAPIWANLFFESHGKTLWSTSMGFHGLPRVGDAVQAGDFSGAVTHVGWATVPFSNELKPTVWVEHGKVSL